MDEQQAKIKEKLEILNYYVNVDDLIKKDVLVSTEIKNLKKKIDERIEKLKNDDMHDVDLIREIIRNKDFHSFYSYLSNIKEEVKNIKLDTEAERFDDKILDAIEEDKDLEYYNNSIKVKMDIVDPYSHISKILRTPHFKDKIGIIKLEKFVDEKTKEKLKLPDKPTDKPIDKKAIIDLFQISDEKLYLPIAYGYKKADHILNILRSFPETEDDILKIIDAKIKKYENLINLLFDTINDKDFFPMKDSELDNFKDNFKRYYDNKSNGRLQEERSVIFDEYRDLLQFIVLKEDNRIHREKELLFDYENIRPESTSSVEINKSKYVVLKIIKILNDIGITKIDLLDRNFFIEKIKLQRIPRKPEQQGKKNIQLIEDYVDSVVEKKERDYQYIDDLFKLTKRIEMKILNFDIIGNLASLPVKPIEYIGKETTLKEDESIFRKFINDIKIENISINCFESVTFESESVNLKLKLNSQYQEISNYLNDFLSTTAFDYENDFSLILILGLLHSNESIKIDSLLKYIAKIKIKEKQNKVESKVENKVEEKVESKVESKMEEKVEGSTETETKSKILETLKKNPIDIQKLNEYINKDLNILKHFFTFLICEFENRFVISEKDSREISKQQFFNDLVKKSTKEIIEKLDSILNRGNHPPIQTNIITSINKKEKEIEMIIENDFLKIDKLYYHTLGRLPFHKKVKLLTLESDKEKLKLDKDEGEKEELNKEEVVVEEEGGEGEELGLKKLEKFQFDDVPFSVVASIKPVITNKTNKEVDYKFIHDYVEFLPEFMYTLKKLLFQITLNEEFDQFLTKKVDMIVIFSSSGNEFFYDTGEIKKGKMAALLYFDIQKNNILPQFIDLIYKNSTLYKKNKIFFIEILKSVLMQENYVLNMNKKNTKIEIMIFPSIGVVDNELVELNSFNKTINKVKMVGTDKLTICQELVSIEKGRSLDLIYQSFYTLQRIVKSPPMITLFNPKEKISINSSRISYFELFQFEKFQKLINVLYNENYDLKKLISSGAFFERKPLVDITSMLNGTKKDRDKEKIRRYNEIYQKCLEDYELVLRVLWIYHIYVDKYEEEKNWMKERIGFIYEKDYFKKYGENFKLDTIYHSTITYYENLKSLGNESIKKENITISNIIKYTFNLINEIFTEKVYKSRQLKKEIFYFVNPDLIYEFLLGFIEDKPKVIDGIIDIYRMLKELIHLKDDYDNSLLTLLYVSKLNESLKKKKYSMLSKDDQTTIFDYHSLMFELSKILFYKLFKRDPPKEQLDKLKLSKYLNTIKKYKALIEELKKKPVENEIAITFEKNISMKRYYERLKKIIPDQTDKFLMRIALFNKSLGDELLIKYDYELDFNREFDHNFPMERDPNMELINKSKKENSESLNYFYYWKFFENYVIKKFGIKFKDNFYRDEDVQKKPFEEVAPEIIKKYDKKVIEIIQFPSNRLLKDYFIYFCKHYNLEKKLLINFISWNLILLKPYNLKEVPGKGFGIFTKQDVDIYIPPLNRIPNLIGFCIPLFFPHFDSIMGFKLEQKLPNMIMLGPIKFLNSSLNNKCKLEFSAYDEKSNETETEKFFKNWVWCGGKFPGVIEWVENTNSNKYIKIKEMKEILVEYPILGFDYDDNNDLGYESVAPKELPEGLKDEQKIEDKPNPSQQSLGSSQDTSQKDPTFKP
jgi:hypothetical protein